MVKANKRFALTFWACVNMNNMILHAEEVKLDEGMNRKGMPTDTHIHTQYTRLTGQAEKRIIEYELDTQ